MRNLLLFPFKTKKGKNYKGYKGDGNAYLEIYADPNDKKWKGEIVSRYHANQKNFIPEWRKKYPTEKLVMRLRINDVFSTKQNGTENLYRILSYSPTIIICFRF